MRKGSQFSDKWLENYKDTHPELFPGHKVRAPHRRTPDVPRWNGFDCEEDFQAAVIRVMWDEFRVHCREGPKGSAGGGKIFYTEGLPDLTCFTRDGRRILFYIELKQPGNFPTQAQLDAQTENREAGFTSEIAYTLDRCREIARLELARCPVTS